MKSEFSAANAAADESTIRAWFQEHVYPETAFPRRLFPDLDDILWRHLQDGGGAPLPADPEALRRRIGLEALLGESPQVVVMLYRRCIERYVAVHHRKPAEQRDIVQEILVRMLHTKIFRIREYYNSSFKPLPSFSSYFMVSVRNIYIDVLREGRLAVARDEELNERIVGSERCPDRNAYVALVLEEEATRVRALLRLFGESAARTELCLKLKLRIAVAGPDVRKAFPAAGEEDVDVLCADFKFVSDKEMYRRIAPVFERRLGQKMHGDSLRKWVDKRLDQIVLHLNRSHGSAVYTKDNLCDFFEYFFQLSATGKKDGDA